VDRFLREIEFFSAQQRFFAFFRGEMFGPESYAFFLKKTSLFFYTHKLMMSMRLPEKSGKLVLVTMVSNLFLILPLLLKKIYRDVI